MITANGRRLIKRYLANQGDALVGAMAIGIGGKAAALNDDRMEFEITRFPISVTDYDFSTDRLVFKGTMDEDVEGSIYEIGIWTNEVNSAPGSQESKLITTFDSESEEWDIKTFDTANTRIGIDSLKHTPAASATSASVLTGITVDLIDYTSLDSFVLAYFVANANAATIMVRLRTDSTNYYQFTISNPATGYQFMRWNKGSATVVGTPSWADINEVEIRTTAKAAGSASVQFDGLRIEDIDSVAPEYGLIARTVLTTPIQKLEGIVQDIEYALPVNIT